MYMCISMQWTPPGYCMDKRLMYLHYWAIKSITQFYFLSSVYFFINEFSCKTPQINELNTKYLSHNFCNIASEMIQVVMAYNPYYYISIVFNIVTECLLKSEKERDINRYTCDHHRRNLIISQSEFSIQRRSIGKTNKTAVNKFGSMYRATAIMYKGGTPLSLSRNESESWNPKNENDFVWIK